MISLVQANKFLVICIVRPPQVAFLTPLVRNQYLRSILEGQSLLTTPPNSTSIFISCQPPLQNLYFLNMPLSLSVLPSVLK